MKDLRPAMPDLLAWVIAWILVTAMFWLVAQAIDSPQGWYTSALLAGIVVAQGRAPIQVASGRRGLVTKDDRVITAIPVLAAHACTIGSWRNAT
ncbi:hypothetical protein [Streptomyces sp. NPDC055681]